LSDEDQCKFLCGLGSIFELKTSSVSASSILFAHTSEGILYNGIGFDEDQVTRLGSSIFEKPFSDCKTLCKWNLVKKTELKQDCCTMCSLSNTYLNGRIESERICLRYTINTGTLVALESNCFLSVVPIASGNDISEYPLLPFYSLLNDYFTSNDPHGPYEQNDLIISFSTFLCDKLSYNDSKRIDIITSCVKREINLLFNFNFAILDYAEVNMNHLELLSPYSYEAPRVVHPDKKTDIPNIVPMKKNTSQKVKADDLKQISIIPNVILSTKMDDKSDTISSGIDPNHESLPAGFLTDEVEVNPVNPTGNVVLKMITDANLDEITEQKNKENSEINMLNIDDTMYINSANNVYDINTNDIVDEENEEENNALLFYPEYNVPTDFAQYIGNCASDDAKSILHFMTDICTSHFISVESVILNSRQGLLFMTSSSGRFYYFDLEYASAGYLYPALSDASKLKFLSMNPIPVISMLYKLGFNTIRVESITGLYCTINSMNSIFDYSDLFDDELSIFNEEHLDFYQFYMPHYDALYKLMFNKLEAIADKKLLSVYNKGLQLNDVLGTNYDLSDIIYQLSTAVSGHGFNDYQFEYNNDIPLIKPGIMYVVNMPSFADKEVEKIRKFFENVSIGVHQSPFKCIRYAKLLSIIDKGIVYFSTMDGDMFFDILLDVVRRNYKKLYDETPLLKTYRIEYK
jgi:hypothetical protein